jgi:hypothetical protein
MIELKTLHGVPIFWAMRDGGFYVSPADLINISPQQVREIAQWCADHHRDGIVLETFWVLGGNIDLQFFTPEELRNAAQSFDLTSHSRSSVDQAIATFWQRHNSTQKTQKPPKRKSGYVYLIKGGDFFKIGVTKSLNSRMKYFQTKLPFEVEELAIIASDDSYGLEKQLHEQFEHKRVNGEWFSLDEEDVETIQSLAA